MPALIDLTGQKFRHWTVLEKDNSRVRDCAYWRCLCDCGEIKSISSSQLRKGTTKSCLMCNRNKLIGQKFGRLTVLEIEHDPPFDTAKGHCYDLKCLCDCGEISIVRSNLLQTGQTKSCGCLKNEPREVESLVGRRFGKLVVLERAPSKRYKDGIARTTWRCVCDCGNVAEVLANNLLINITTSCGCMVSRGEEKIAKILSENNIDFLTEYTFSDLVSRTGTPYRFDFAILFPQLYLIEYDGIQHFKNRDDNGWNTAENLLAVQERDKEKNKYCINNNIPLIRIPYYHYNKLSLVDLLVNTTNFLLNGENDA